MEIIDSRNTNATFKMAIIVSRFNSEVTTKLLEGALKRAKEVGLRDEELTVVWVPGAVEIPITAQRLAQRAVYEAIICLGAVIRGETTHYDYVCEQVSSGCSLVGLQNDLPIIFGVLTTENEEQAFDRCGGKHGHKGSDAVDTAVEMVQTLRKLV